MNFCSDNVASACPEILAHLAAINRVSSRMPYGSDPVTEAVAQDFQSLFKTDCQTYPVATGTAANALSLALSTPRYGAIFCHEESHIFIDECGAVEQMTAGARLHPLPGAHGKIDCEALRSVLAQGWAGVVHHVQPAVVSISQPTELGTLYSLDDIKALSDICKEHGLFLHMDGARFANALEGLKVSADQMTWGSGVDILSFGATKNGAMAAEAVVIFNEQLKSSGHFEFLRKRAGHLFSKMVFISAQLQAYLKDDLWRNNAAHSNAMAQKLYAGLVGSGCVCDHPVQANEIFVHFEKAKADALFEAGFQFYNWPLGGEDCYRLVTCWLTEERDVDHFIRILRASS